jgi:DNA processing protein
MAEFVATVHSSHGVGKEDCRAARLDTARSDVVFSPGCLMWGRGMGDEKAYWIALSRVGGIGAVRFRKLLDAFGSIGDAWRATPEELRGCGIGPAAASALIEGRTRIDPECELARVTDAGFGALTWLDEGYPDRLREIAQPPPVLYASGQIEARDRWAVAVVGTRRPTAYGTSAARDLGRVLAGNGVVVVSGLARGIDALAHQAALEAGGRTVAVLGSGLDQVYPPEHRGLAARIQSSGAVVSDYPLGTKPDAANFPARNRIISGLAAAVVVVEAGEGSGALITADFGAEQGREVFAVPGSIYSRSSRGCHRLIENGARPLIGFEDVLEALNMEAAVMADHQPERLPEDETERSVIRCLSAEPVHVDELHVRSGLPVATLTAALAMLELKGLARQVGGMHYVRLRETGSPYRVD